MSMYEVNISDPLQHFADMTEFDEIYEVVRTVIVAGANWKYYPPHYYTVLAYVEDMLNTERVLDKERTVVGQTRIWTRWASFPEVHESEADTALTQALNLLRKRLDSHRPQEGGSTSS